MVSSLSLYLWNCHTERRLCEHILSLLSLSLVLYLIFFVMQVVSVSLTLVGFVFRFENCQIVARPPEISKNDHFSAFQKFLHSLLLRFYFSYTSSFMLFFLHFSLLPLLSASFSNSLCISLIFSLFFHLNSPFSRTFFYSRLLSFSIHVPDSPCSSFA